MLDIPNKVPGSQFFSDECNSIASELENAVTATGQVLTGADSFQLAKTLTNATSRADFYTDSGIANAYQLDPLAGFQQPTSYQNGLRVRFKVSNSNTGASTLKIGTLGIKPIKKDNNSSDIEANDLIAGKYAELVFDGPNDVFELLVLHEQSTAQDTIRVAGQGYLPFGMGSDYVNTIQFEIQPGNIKARNNSDVQIFLESAITKSINASWVEGTNQGGLAEGLVLQSNSNYYAFAVSKSTGEVDIVIDDNPNATNVFGVNVTAAGYVNYAEVWRLRTNSVSQVSEFTRFNNIYYFNEIRFAGTISPGLGQFSILTQAPPNTTAIVTYKLFPDSETAYIVPHEITQTLPVYSFGSIDGSRDSYIPTSDGYLRLLDPNLTVTSADIFISGYVYNGAFKPGF